MTERVTLRLGRPVAPDPAPLLSTRQRDAFHQDGFLAIEALLDEAAMARLRALLDGLLARSAPRDDGMRFDYLSAEPPPAGAERLMQQLLPFDYEPAFFETQLFHRGARLARDLLGVPLRYRGSHYMEKPPRVGPATPLHQDEAFWEPTHRHEAIAVWVPLEGADEESGCMEFHPGSHRALELLPHRRIGGDPRVHGLELDLEACADLDPSTAIRCPVPVGGATVHHCRVVHGSGPNRSARPRRALVLNFEAPPELLETPREVPWQETESELAARRAARGIQLP